MQHRFEQLPLVRVRSALVSGGLHFGVLLVSLLVYGWLVPAPPPRQVVCVQIESVESEPGIDPDAELPPIEAIEVPPSNWDPSPPEPPDPVPSDPVPSAELPAQTPRPRAEPWVEAVADSQPESFPPGVWLLRIRRPIESPPTPVVELRPVASAAAVIVPIEGQNRPPRYPTRALRLGIQGSVELALVVDDCGRVTHCVVSQSSGSSLLDRAAVRAVRAWRFKGGPGSLCLPVHFTLRS